MGGEGGARRRSLPHTALRRALRRLSRQYRKFQPHFEPRRVVVEGYRAVVEAGGGADEAEAEAVAGGAAAALEANEAVEDGVAVLLGDAGAVVRDLERGVAVDLPDRQRDLAGRFGAGAIFERVVEQVRHRLRQDVAVAADLHAGGTVELEDKAGFLGDGLVKFSGGLGELAQVE